MEGHVAAPRGQEPHDAHGLCGPHGAEARSQAGGDQRVRGPCAKAPRQGARVLSVGMSACPRLRPMRGIIGGVDSEDEGWGRLGGTREAGGNQGPREPREVLTVSRGFQTRAPEAHAPRLALGPRGTAPHRVGPGGLGGGEWRHGRPDTPRRLDQGAGPEGPPWRSKRGGVPLSMESGGPALRQSALTGTPPQHEGTNIR